MTPTREADRLLFLPPWPSARLFLHLTGQSSAEDRGQSGRLTYPASALRPASGCAPDVESASQRGCHVPCREGCFRLPRALVKFTVSQHQDLRADLQMAQREGGG